MKRNKFMEKILQKQRFSKVLPYIRGNTLLDFGGNKGELKEFVTQEYTCCNHNYDMIGEKRFDCIVALAVIEHLYKEDFFKVMKMLVKHLNEKGRIIITTPAKPADFFLRIMAKFRILGKENLDEHKHYWNEEELLNLAEINGLQLKLYKKFQFGMNQLLIVEKKKWEYNTYAPKRRGLCKI